MKMLKMILMAVMAFIALPSMAGMSATTVGEPVDTAADVTVTVDPVSDSDGGFGPYEPPTDTDGDGKFDNRPDC